MILDATAGNRTMWQQKNNQNIIYIDIEKTLTRKPTMFADNTLTPFLSQTFDTIFYDPPHSWDTKTGFFSFTTREEYNKMYKPKKSIPTYYGWDKYKTRRGLVAHVYRAQKEFQRILKHDGLLWLKWNEVEIPYLRIKGCFTDWHELLRIYVKSPRQSAGKGQSYWVCLCKKKVDTEQTELN